MEDLFDRVQEQADSLPEVMQEIRDEGLPLVLLGAGRLAECYADLMGAEGIAIAEMAVDRKYWRPDLRFRGRPVRPMEDAIALYPKVNVFCAFQFTWNTLRVREALLASGRVGRVFLYDSGCTHFGMHTLTRDVVEIHRADFVRLDAELADDRSRQTLAAYLNQRISGRPGYLEAVYDEQHLFPLDILPLGPGEIFMDCGAYDGESVLDFERAMQRAGAGPVSRIYAWEPDAANRRMIEQRCANLGGLEVVPKGAWSRRDTLRFAADGGATSRIAEGPGHSIEVDTIDHLLAGRPVTYIKMDVEGAELEALKGAEQTIRRCRPKLGICVYHRATDLLEIPALIRSFRDDYRLYLRAHSYGANDLLLYAV